MSFYLDFYIVSKFIIKFVNIENDPNKVCYRPLFFMI